MVDSGKLAPLTAGSLKNFGYSWVGRDTMGSAVPVEETVIEGEVRFYEQTAESGSTVGSGFCANCGSPMLKKTAKRPDLYFFPAGTLDDPATFKPQVVVYSNSGQLWDHIDPEISRN